MTARQRRRVAPVFPPGTVLLEPVEDRDDWRDLALCAEVDGDTFFPDKGESTLAAKKTCRFCEVRQPCLEYALATDQRFGVWGGLSERERRKLRKDAAA
jgi:WhiB family redox-sensing transcriptional regulator